MTRLVTLRTKPIEDPGEWCVTPGAAQYCDLWNWARAECRIGHCVEIKRRGIRRPQSCIDSAEEVEP